MGGFLTTVLNFITGGLVGKVVDAFIAHDAAKQAALNDQQRLAFEERQQAATNAKEIRLATAGYWEMRAIAFLIALPFVLHLWLVGLDTCFGFGWRIAKFPAPFDQWEGAILLSFFGVAGAVQATRAVAGAVALPRRRRNLLQDLSGGR